MIYDHQTINEVHNPDESFDVWIMNQWFPASDQSFDDDTSLGPSRKKKGVPLVLSDSD